jgi:protocatechuate 3,4-dioxygenase beta subunit
MKNISPKSLIHSKLKIIRKKILLLCMLCTIGLGAGAQTTISGLVFNDANNNGIKDGSEVGYPNVTVNAYSIGCVGPFATTTTLSTGTGIGTYTLTGLIPGINYRIEFIKPDDYYDGAFGSSMNSSVKFAMSGDTAVHYGFRLANECIIDDNPRLIAGAGKRSGETKSVRSWRFLDRHTTGSNQVEHPHDKDILFSEVGVPYAITTQHKTHKIFMTPINSPIAGVFPPAPHGRGAIYIADYSGSNYSYVGYKYLCNIDTLGYNTSNQYPIGTETSDSMSHLSGTSGIALTDDGKTLYVVNAGNGTIVKIDISNVDYAQLPITAPTTANTSVITIPTTAHNATNGRFRPTSIDVKGNTLYIAGVNDGSSGTDADCFLKIITMNIVTGEFKTIFSYNPNNIKSGNTNTGSWPTVRWKSTYNEGFDNTFGFNRSGVQPYISDFDFDDYGGIVLGVSDRKVLGPASGPQLAGYIVRLSKKVDGTYEMENNGQSGNFTSQVPKVIGLDDWSNTAIFDKPTDPGLGCNYEITSAISDGPGGDWFYAQGGLGGMYNGYGNVWPQAYLHSYLYSSGVFVQPGSNLVVGGYIDPLNAQTFGVRYLDATTGRNKFGKHVGGQKALAITGVEAVCDENPVEIGDRVWNDVNANGIQDANEPSLVGVTVALYDSLGNFVASAVTDANGHYIFSNSLEHTSTLSLVYGLSLEHGEIYTIKVFGMGTDPSVSGLSLTNVTVVPYELVNTTNSGNSLANNDAFLVSGKPSIQIRMGSPGQNNHTYDFGFSHTSPPPCTPPNAGPDMTVCAGTCATLTAISPLNGCWQASQSNSNSPFTLLATGNGTAQVCFTNEASGVFVFKYVVSFNCEDSILVTVTPVKAGPNSRTCFAGGNGIAHLQATGTGTWSALASNPGTSSISNNTDDTTTVSNFSAVGLYKYIWTTGSCTDTVQIEVFSNGTIGNHVWYDSNGNGYFDEPANAGLNGILVKLYNVSTRTYVDSMLTTNDASSNPGYYNFNVCETALYLVQFPIVYGTDSLSVNMPSGMNNAGMPNINIDKYNDAQRADGKTYHFEIDINGTGLQKNNFAIDASYTPAVPVSPCGTIGNYVWKDIDNNGYQTEPLSAGLNGVKVVLLDNANTRIDSTFTANDNIGNPGFYRFVVCTPGSYKVLFPSSVGDSIGLTPRVGGGPWAYNDWRNSDPDPTTGITGAVTLTLTGTAFANYHTVDIDAGYIGNLGALGNHVWQDSNGDGIFNEPTNSGINGVKVVLLANINSVTTPIDSVFTANDSLGRPGYYNFAIRFSGSYKLKFPTLVGADSLTYFDNSISIDSNSNPNRTTGETDWIVMNLSGGVTSIQRFNYTIDAGYKPNLPLPCGNIGNYVWKDYNADGYNNEPPSAGINGVKVVLLNASSVRIDSTLTANDVLGNPGYYNFTVCTSGNYYLEFPVYHGGDTLTLNTSVSTDNIGSDPSASTGFTGWVTIDLNQSGVSRNNYNIDAGYKNTSCGSVGNQVWWDVNRDGNWTGENTGSNPNIRHSRGLDGVTVELWNVTTNTLVASQMTYTDTYTGEKGRYMFPVCSTDSFKVKFATQVDSFNLTKQRTINIANNWSTANIQTGFSKHFYMDMNGTGVLKNNPNIDAGYVLCATAVQTADQSVCAGSCMSLTASGTNLTHGTWFAVSSNPTGATLDTTANGIAQVCFTSTALGQFKFYYDLGGNCKDTVTLSLNSTGSIGNYAWFDANENGINDEPAANGINGLVVNLYNATTNTLVATTSTSNDGSGNPGYYNFAICQSGDYIVKFPLMSDSNVITIQSVTTGIDNNSDANPNNGLSPVITIDLNGAGVAKNNNTIDAGYKASSVPCGSVGNYVWLDSNRNGLYDEASSAGINGVNVELWNATTNTLVSSTSTANNGLGNSGYYSFSVCTSGDYFVKFPSMSGINPLTTQTPTAGTDNNSDANTTTGNSPIFTIDVNGTGLAKDNNTIDAGYKIPTACLGNYVWNDANHDGIQNNGEVGVSGVTVSLLNSSNVTLATLTTDAYGFYQFCNLDAGSYKLQFSLPANYVFTGQNAPDDTQDSDPNVFTGITDIYTILPGDSNMTVDAGIFQPMPTTATVGNRVWFDADSDGVQDNNETGVSGITVSLYACGNLATPIATTLTDAGGNYLFENVLPGSYAVGFSTPIGMVFTTQSGSVSDVDNSDVNPSTERTACFGVIGGDNITYVDAGLKVKPPTSVSLGDKVWNDADQNGIQDSSESGVQGVTVTLYETDGVTVLSTTTTDALGNYGFHGINPGCYVIGFSGLPSGYSFTTQGAGSDSTKNSDANAGTGKTSTICITSGNNTTIDAGVYNASNTNSIGDRVWYDENQDGVQDATEYGYPGVVVTLYECTTNNIVATTTTNATGTYSFNGIANGDYYVGFGFVPGYRFTGQNSDLAGILGANNSDANPSSGLTACVSLTGNTNVTSVDAGLYPGNTRTATSSLGDIVWTDVNSNGLQDIGETGVPNVTVTLYEDDGITVVATTTTDGLGNYIFTNLDGGAYIIGFSNLPSGYTFTTPSGQVDDESNSDADVLTGKTSIIALGVGEDKMTIDAGIVAPASTVCLGDYVWIDLDNDGIQESGEPAVPGVTVKLYAGNSTTVLQVATTNTAGQYLFCGLTNGGTYSVGFENLPSGFSFTTQTGVLSVTDNSDADPLTGRTSTVTLGASNDLTLDAGIYSTTTAVVGNYVWNDEDADGIQDPTEAPIAGVLVTLYDNTNTPVASAVTDANGGYLFTNVIPGIYTIGFEGYPSTLVPTTKGTDANADNDSNLDPITNRTDAFTVTSGSSNLTLDAGFKANPIAGLGNYVWHDANENGLQDASEPGISGVIVTLYESDGTTVRATAITDGNGAYSFPNLPAGSYVVGFTAPLGFTRTQSIGALNDALNSDIDATNKTGVITLVAGQYNPNADAGYYLGIPLPARELKATLAVLSSENTCDVSWYTRIEENTAWFEIERGVNNQQFEKVGTKMASGTTHGLTNYKFVDDISNAGAFRALYYRIKLIDIDGKHTYSNVIHVSQVSTEETMAVYPNPFNHEILIEYLSESEDVLELTLTDLSGRVVSRAQKTITKGMNTITLDQLSHLSSGHYYLKVSSLENGFKYLRKLSK